jgi:hypothetical protein
MKIKKNAFILFVTLIFSCSTASISRDSILGNECYLIFKVESDYKKNNIILEKYPSTLPIRINLNKKDLGEYRIIKITPGKYYISIVNGKPQQFGTNLHVNPEILLEVVAPGVYYLGDIVISAKEERVFFPQIPENNFNLIIVNNYDDCVKHHDGLIVQNIFREFEIQ